MFGTRLSAGVEVTASSVRIALLSLKASPTVLKCEEVPVNPGEEQRCGAIISQALERLGARDADVHLAFSGQPGTVRHQLFVAPDKLTRAELRAVAARELKRDASLDLKNAVFAVSSLGKDETEAGGQRHLLVALHREQLEEVATGLLDHKRVVRTATTAPMALFRAATVADVPEQGIVALALLDPRRSSLIVLEKGVPRFFREIPTAFGTGRESDNSLVAQALARELDISLVYFAQQHRPRQVDTVMIVGEPAVADRVSEWMEEVPKYRVVRFGAGPKLAVDPAVTANLSAFAVAIGAALGPKVKAVPDLLPTELRGRPERAYALVAAAVVAVLFLAVTVQLRQKHVQQRLTETARAEAARNDYSDLEHRVELASRTDVQASQARKWQELFENHDTYHLRYAQLLHGIPRALPDRAKVTVLDISDPSKRSNLVPGVPVGAPAADAPNLRLHLEGLVRAGDVSTAQGDLRLLVQTLERMPTVKSVELSPIKAPAGSAGGLLDLPFTIDVLVHNTFPGPVR